MTLALACLLGTAMCGCARTMVEDSAADHWPAPEDELDFWDDLGERAALTNHDALHGLLLAEDPSASYDSYEAHLAAAVDREWVGSNAHLPANEVAEIGMISVAVCRMLDISGGVTMSILGPSPRYATRELVYLGILPDRSPNQAMTGVEFMDLLRKVESYRTRRPDFQLAAASGTDVAQDPDDGQAMPDTTNETTVEEVGEE